MAQKIKKTILAAGLLILFGLAFTPIRAGAACDPRLDPGDPQCAATTPTNTPTSSTEDCNNPSPTADSLNSCVKTNPITNDLNVIVNILAALVGVVVTGSIILGGVQYSMAGDSPDAVGKAKQRISNGLIALAAFLLTYGLLQWLIPGGVFS